MNIATPFLAHERRRPLAGVRVLDLTRLLPGNYATQMLADFGADVIKVEAPEGDPARWSPPMTAEGSLYYALLNRNKRSIALDLKTTAGRDVLLRLIASADVLIESFRPGVMARLALAPETLRSLFPRLIYCAITGYGQDGPDAGHPGHDLNYLGRAGIVAMNRPDPTASPVLPPTQIADLAGGALPAVIGIMLALFARHMTGRGDFVDVSMLDSAIALQPLALAGILAGIDPQPGTFMLHGGDPAYALYQTSDGQYLTLAALEPKFWQRFCALIGRPDLIPMHGMAALAHREEVRDTLTSVFAQRTRDEWLARLGGEETCVAPVLSFSEALADPHVQARGVVHSADLGMEDRGSAFTPFPRLATAAPPADHPPPLLGEHGREVLAEAAMTEAEIDALIRQHIVLIADPR